MLPETGEDSPRKRLDPRVLKQALWRKSKVSQGEEV